MKMKLFVLMGLILVLSACGSPFPTETPEPPAVNFVPYTVYFLDQAKFNAGTEPYEVAVTRETHPDAFIPRMALESYIAGPTEEEASQGLVQVLSGCTGFSNFRIEDGVAYVHLLGPCASGGSTYTIANPVMKTLKQFDEIQYVKIFDADGNTEQPNGKSDSIPFALEP